MSAATRSGRAKQGAEDQDAFIARRKRSWEELEALLSVGKELHRRDGAEISQTASLYRSVCADLMRARASYGPELVRYLDGLAARSHNTLYGTRAYRLIALWELVARDFPRTLRRRWRFFALASALFYLPFIFGLLGTLASSDFATTILPPQQLAMMEEMYQQGFDAGRDAAEDSAMAGFYVLNNVGIAFRCFATGILFGVGSLFFSIYNGLVIGVTLGWVIRVGYGANILTFICSHGPFELTAIVISAGAGLQMGWALIKTDGLTRLASLRAQARELGHLIMGAAAMLVIAAGLEGFWSPSSLPPPVKWTASGVFTLLVIAWLGFGGRARRPHPSPLGATTGGATWAKGSSKGRPA
ncbi:stage II sporulation protein M [Pseudenhygromyxa sp. WMMC2535]|uniref:stage II sporulation protein M n=1 Tax=Pseudenhygromyxa sp. WMMC2535 TaxID=2712867 RepID=UPI001555CB83|nr:stage II sporulation protein M [Pseudenhygromyxa sp. WMMC2535]NVB38311.1 stage II sporulation protein M [Pseudenhygromyxa sp. WMMC2535]